VRDLKEKTAIESVYDENGKFSSKRMELQLKRLKEKAKIEIMSQEEEITEKEAEKLAEKIIDALLKIALKTSKKIDIKIWYWWTTNKHYIYAITLGLIFSFTLELLR
jgi:hypothetical protein